MTEITDQFSLYPLRTEQTRTERSRSIGEILKEALKEVEALGLTYEVSSMSTELRGHEEQVFAALKAAYERAAAHGYDMVLVATVGLTEAQAAAQGYDVKVSSLPLAYVPRALAARDTRGLIKLVADQNSDRLLGANVLAAEAGEVIQTAALAVKFGLKHGFTVTDLHEMLFPYLMQVEGLKLAARAFEKDVAQLSCCAG